MEGGSYFARCVLKVLPILFRTFSTAKYEAGVDVKGAARQVTAEETSEISTFELRELENLTHDSLFGIYSVAVVLIDDGPRRLASKSETCPCHAWMFIHLSDHHRRKLFAEHFGP